MYKQKLMSKLVVGSFCKSWQGGYKKLYCPLGRHLDASRILLKVGFNKTCSHVVLPTSPQGQREQSRNRVWMASDYDRNDRLLESAQLHLGSVKGYIFVEMGREFHSEYVWSIGQGTKHCLICMERLSRNCRCLLNRLFGERKLNL